jgi:hypothetical protein
VKCIQAENAIEKGVRKRKGKLGVHAYISGARSKVCLRDEKIDEVYIDSYDFEFRKHLTHPECQMTGAAT